MEDFKKSQCVHVVISVNMTRYLRGMERVKLFFQSELLRQGNRFKHRIGRPVLEFELQQNGC